MDLELLTVAEVAAQTRCHEKTVREWIRSGVLPAIRLPGGRYRVARTTLDEVMREGEIEACHS
jgi:excisionase family DNA binding protein